MIYYCNWNCFIPKLDIYLKFKFHIITEIVYIWSTNSYFQGIDVRSDLKHVCMQYQILIDLSYYFNASCVIHSQRLLQSLLISIVCQFQNLMHLLVTLYSISNGRSHSRCLSSTREDILPEEVSWRCGTQGTRGILLQYNTIQYNKLYLKSENIKHYNTSSNELLNPT